MRRAYWVFVLVFSFSVVKAQSTSVPTDSLLKLGIVRLNSGANKQAILDFTTVLQQDPKNYQALMKRGEARRMILDSLGSLYDFSTVIKIYPDSAEPFFQRALCYKVVGSYIEAQIELNQAVAMAPNNSNYLYERGLNRIVLKEYELAIADFTEFLKLRPQHPKALYNRGYCYYQIQKPEPAVMDLSESIVIEPSPEAYFQRALIKQYYKKYNDAILDFDNAINLDPNYDEAKYARGILLANTGNNQGLKDLADIGLAGYQKAADALRRYRDTQRDSMMVYQVPEIVVEAMKPEYQEAVATTKKLAQISNTAINFFVSTPLGKFDGQTHPLLRTDGPDNLPGQWTINEGQCNPSIIQTQGSSRLSIYCIVYILRQKVDKLKDPQADKLMREVEDYLNQIDNVRVTVPANERNTPEQLGRTRELVIQIQVAIGRLQSRMNKIQELTANMQ
ncbi:MAG: tetratricopeptide repeat protein [Chloroherpetonaceae bacterium]|nr:tetratricopeptide repeat protein [Chloroherpetonaceae bacterium]